MRNPVFFNKQIIQLYLTGWILLMAAHACLSFYTENFTLYQALADTIISDVLFAGMALGIWYPVRYLDLKKRSVITFLLHHCALAATFIFIWISTVGCFTDMLIDDPRYQYLFRQSVPWRIMVTFLFYCMAVLGCYLYIYYSSFKQKQVTEAKLKSLVKEAELNLLKSQLNPHFIFNSLNSISSLTISDPACAQEMVIKLSSYIRYALQQKGNELVSFFDELENAKLYLDIEKARFGNKLILENFCEEDSLKAKVPNMLLQPLLENAIKYGVYESMQPVTIKMEGNMSDNDLKIVITNTYESNIRFRQGNGIGLKNIKERLLLMYGTVNLLSIRDSNDIFRVEILVPQLV